jgi:hypothetical protein
LPTVPAVSAFSFTEMRRDASPNRQFLRRAGIFLFEVAANP